MKKAFFIELLLAVILLLTTVWIGLMPMIRNTSANHRLKDKIRTMKQLEENKERSMEHDSLDEAIRTESTITEILDILRTENSSLLLRSCNSSSEFVRTNLQGRWDSLLMALHRVETAGYTPASIRFKEEVSKSDGSRHLTAEIIFLFGKASKEEPCLAN